MCDHLAVECSIFNIWHLAPLLQIVVSQNFRDHFWSVLSPIINTCELVEISALNKVISPIY